MKTTVFSSDETEDLDPGAGCPDIAGHEEGVTERLDRLLSSLDEADSEPFVTAAAVAILRRTEWS